MCISKLIVGIIEGDLLREHCGDVSLCDKERLTRVWLVMMDRLTDTFWKHKRDKVVKDNAGIWVFILVTVLQCKNSWLHLNQLQEPGALWHQLVAFPNELAMLWYLPHFISRLALVYFPGEWKLKAVARRDAVTWFWAKQKSNFDSGLF